MPRPSLCAWTLLVLLAFACQQPTATAPAPSRGGASAVDTADEPPPRSGAEPTPDYVRVVQPPATSPPPGERAPVLVLLHGYGSHERDLLSLGASVDPRLLVVSLRAPLTVRDGRYAWYPLDWSGSGPRARPEDVRAAADALARWLPTLPEAVGGDPERVFLMGFSQGAIMSAELAARGAPIAGVVALSGRPPQAPLSGCEAAPPLFIAHGDADAVIPVAQGRALRDAFAEPCPELDLTYQEIPGSAHAIARPTRAALRSWLRARI